MDMPSKDRRFPYALVASLALVVACVLAQQWRFARDASRDIATDKLQHAARTLQLQSSALGRRLDEPPRGTSSADRQDSSAQTARWLAHGVDQFGAEFAFIKTPNGKLQHVAGRLSNSVARSLKDVNFSGTRFVIVDGQTFALAVWNYADSHAIFGFAFDDADAVALAQTLGSQISVVSVDQHGALTWHASSLSPATRALLANSVGPGLAQKSPWSDVLGDDAYRFYAIRHLPSGEGKTVAATLLAEPLAVLAPPFATQFRNSVLVACIALLGGFGAIAYCTPRKHRHMHHLDVPDDITGLDSRAMLNRSLADMCSRALADSTQLCVLMLDLDRFKLVNDTLGHDAGDVVLHEVAKRLSSALRSIDVIARQGGDEFVIVLPGSGARDIEQVAVKLSRALEQPILVNGTMVDVAASIGIAILPDDATTPRDLLRLSDSAMFAAKRRHAPWLRWSQECDTSSVGELSLLGELREALELGHLELHYQPLLKLPARRVVAAEALIRWRHPERGLIPPQEFVPFAEATGFMRGLTRWVIENAVVACSDWRAAGFTLRVDVNVTPQDLYDVTLTDFVGELLARHALDGSCLCLELTETAFMDKPERVAGVMLQFRKMGVAIAVDDFGTGYSSLAYVRELPVSEIKIDRTFTAGLGEGYGSTSIANSAIELGRSLNLDVVAEGVEDSETLELLQQMGCSLVQGYYICRPLPENEFVAWLTSAYYATVAAPIIRVVNA